MLGHMVWSLGWELRCLVTLWGPVPALALAAASTLKRDFPESFPDAGNSWFVFICGLRLSTDNCIPQRYFSQILINSK